MMIHCCAVGSQLTPLEHSILGGPACVLQRICLHPTQIFWHLIFTTLNHSRDKYKTKVTGNVIYMNPTSFTLSCLISEVLYLASISNNYYIHFKKKPSKECITEVRNHHLTVGVTQHTSVPHHHTPAYALPKGGQTYSTELLTLQALQTPTVLCSLSYFVHFVEITQH